MGVAGFRLRQSYSHQGAGPIDTSYSLWNTARPENEAGWSGKVVRIGWDARRIIVLRAPPSSPYGERGGWMVIDAEHRTQSAVMTLTQLQQRPDLHQINIYRADSAWAKL